MAATMNTATFPRTLAMRIRRQLLGISLQSLAQETGLPLLVLRALEQGEYDPRSLHGVSLKTLEKRLDMTLFRL